MKTLFSLLLTLITILVVIVAGTGLWVYKLSKEIPDDSVIRNFKHDAATIIYDKDGKALIIFREDKNRIWVPLSGISTALREALIATEDPYFMRHSGIDYRQTWESVKDNLRVWQWVRGGSTITQQVAKNVFLSNEKTISRKIKEYFLARRLEKLLPKERIIELYLNEVGWGYGIYGVELASRFYLDKHAIALNPSESAFLISMLRNPASYNPYKNFEKVINRRQLVLKLLLRHKLLTEDEYNESLSYKIELRREKKIRQFTRIGLREINDMGKVLPCHAQLIRDYLLKTLGYNMLYDVGIDIRSSLDDLIQHQLENIIREVEQEYEEDSGNSNKQQKELLLVLNKNKVRAIGCTTSGMKAAERMKWLGKPFDSYQYNITSDSKILWNDILLIDTGGENTL
ncbi:MAG: transglycosylase domain-containing protein [Nitrospirota bacterium]